MAEKATISGENVAHQQPEYPPPYEENPPIAHNPQYPQNPPTSQNPHYPPTAQNLQYPQIQAQPQPIIVQPGQRVLVVNPVGSIPSTITCNLCGMQVTTSVVFRPSVRTHMAAFLLCLVGCWPIACLPYCIESCNSVDHFCPNCKGYIGSYRN